MNKAAFIIPIHEPHYKYLTFLDNALDNKEVDIYLVLTYIKEKLTLPKWEGTNYVRAGLPVSPVNPSLIILEEHLPIQTITNMFRRQCYITFKKLFALSILHSKYDYIAIVDSEIMFKNVNKVYDKFKKYCNDKQLIGCNINPASEHLRITKDIAISSSIFYRDNAIYEKLLKKTDELTLYFWYSNIHIYDCSIVPNFLLFVDFYNYDTFISKINYMAFDYVIYGYYALIFHDYNIVNIKEYGIDRNWSLEGCNLEIYKTFSKNSKIVPLWIIDHNYISCDETADVILTYHIDRKEGTVLDNMPNF